MTEASPELRSLLRQLLYAHHAARQLGEHEVSFHLLSAAARAAERLADADTLEEVARLSRDELGWLERNQPAHALVSGSATPEHPGTFEQLAVTATATLQRISGGQMVEHAQTHPTDDA